MGILGPNGSGKSSILEAIDIGMTGTGRDELESYVKSGNTSGTIELDFQQGQAGKITRQLGKTSRRSLEWDTRKPITAAKEVEEVMEKVMGADKYAVSSAVFIKQNQLQDLLFSLPSQREDMFVKLVNLAYCDQRVRYVDGKIKKLQATVTDMTAQKDTAGQAVLAGMDALKAKEAELTGLQDNQDAILWCQTMLDYERQLNQASQDLLTAQGQMNSARANLDEYLRVQGIKDPDSIQLAYQTISGLWTKANQDAIAIERGIQLVRDHARLEAEQASARDKLAAVEKQLEGADPAWWEEKISQNQEHRQTWLDYQRVNGEVETLTAQFSVVGSSRDRLKPPGTDEAVLTWLNQQITDLRFLCKQLQGWLDFRTKMQASTAR